MNSKNVIPNEDFLFLKPVTPQIEVNGIVTPTGQPAPNIGEIVKAGKFARPYKTGQKVFFRSEDKEVFKISNEVFFFLTVDDVIGTYKEPKEESNG